MDSIFRVDASQDDDVVIPPGEVQEGLREMCNSVFSWVGLGLRTGSPRTTSYDQVEMVGLFVDGFLVVVLVVLLQLGGDLMPKEAEMAAWRV